MTSQLQEGIYINNKIDNSTSGTNRNKTFALIFLRVKKNARIEMVRECLADLWNSYERSRVGRVTDSTNYIVPHGSITILIGYGLPFFELRGLGVRAPTGLRLGQFMPSRRGSAILKGSGINYGKLRPVNVGLREGIMIQVISNSQLATFRTVQETWQSLNRRICPIYFSTFFTGFERDDSRGWLGFHDQSSNLKSANERKKVVIIDRENNNLPPQDLWTEDGTYMAFLRINIDLSVWNQVGLKKQELIVGRNKLTGQPLIAVDAKGDPIYQSNTPNRFRRSMLPFGEHPNYFVMPRLKDKKMSADLRQSFKILNQTHIGRVRHIKSISAEFPASRRIFRQSFHFIESSVRGSRKPLVVGLNFVSFQNDPARLLFILTDPHWMGKSNFGGGTNDPTVGKLLTVDASGVFYVPSKEKPFPGASIFP